MNCSVITGLTMTGPQLKRMYMSTLLQRILAEQFQHKAEGRRNAKLPITVKSQRNSCVRRRFQTQKKKTMGAKSYYRWNKHVIQSRNSEVRISEFENYLLRSSALPRTSRILNDSASCCNMQKECLTWPRPTKRIVEPTSKSVLL